MKRSLSMSILLFSFLSVSGHHAFPDYAVDENLAHILDKHSTEIFAHLRTTHEGAQKWGVWQFKWLPGYYVKYGLARIEGRKKILDCIETFGLDKVTVPDKYVYHVKGRPYNPHNLNYAIIIKEVPAASNPKSITLDEMMQLVTVMRETGYISMHGKKTRKGPNYIRTPDKKFCIIDTESRFDFQQSLKGFIRIIKTHHLRRELSDEAVRYIFEHIQQQMLHHPCLIRWGLKLIKQFLSSQENKSLYRSMAQSYLQGMKKYARIHCQNA